MKYDIVIVGGGITGLTAAYTLQKANPDLHIALFEAGELGGKLRTDQIDGMVIERGPDSFLSRKPAGIALCDELGVTDQLIGRIPENRQTFVKYQSKLHPLPEGLTGLVPTNLDALYATDLFSDEAVARFAEETTIPPLDFSDLNADQEESIETFLVRRFGRIPYERLMEPLMGGIYGGRADLLSVDAIFPNLRRLEQEHGSILRGLQAKKMMPDVASHPPFVSFKGGIQTLVDALVAQIKPEAIHEHAPVERLTKTTDGNGYLLQVGGQSVMCKQILLTTPAWATGQILGEAFGDLAAALNQIPYASSALVTLAFNADDLDKKPVGYGYVIPRVVSQVDGRDILACTFSSNKWRGRAPDDRVLVRLFLGRYGNDMTQQSDHQLIEMARQELAESVGVTAAPIFTNCYRWARGMPQYTLRHQARMQQIDEALYQHPGVHMAGALDGGVGIPDCIRSGRKGANLCQERRQ